MTDGGYTWFDPSGRTPEQERLERQAVLYDPITLRVLEAARLSQGMRVLELGSGAGDVTILLSRIVGPTGSVVGVERSPEAVLSTRERLAAAGITNVDLLVGDVADVRPGTGFDAIVGRLILMYLPDPGAVLSRLAARLRPGGTVCMMEISWDHLSRPETPLFAELARLIRTAFLRSGAHIDMGERLHATFRSAGLPAPELRYERPAGGPERPVSEYLRDELVGLRPLLEREQLPIPAGLDPAILAERLDADLARTGGIATLWPMVGAWVQVGLPHPRSAGPNARFNREEHDRDGGEGERDRCAPR